MRRVPTLLFAALVVTACGGGSTALSSDVCDGPIREELQPGSLTHVVTVDEAEHVGTAPTSGPHLSVITRLGAVEEPLFGAEQVAILESAGVLIQYRDLDDPARPELEALASTDGNGLSPKVVVAPNPELEHRIVATAWTQRYNCDGIDIAALEAFIDEFLLKDTGSH